MVAAEEVGRLLATDRRVRRDGVESLDDRPWLVEDRMIGVAHGL